MSVHIKIWIFASSWKIQLGSFGPTFVHGKNQLGLVNSLPLLARYPIYNSTCFPQICYLCALYRHLSKCSLPENLVLMLNPEYKMLCVRFYFSFSFLFWKDILALLNSVLTRQETFTTILTSHKVLLFEPLCHIYTYIRM